MELVDDEEVLLSDEEEVLLEEDDDDDDVVEVVSAEVVLVGAGLSIVIVTLLAKLIYVFASGICKITFPVASGPGKISGTKPKEIRSFTASSFRRPITDGTFAPLLTDNTTGFVLSYAVPDGGFWLKIVSFAAVFWSSVKLIFVKPALFNAAVASALVIPIKFGTEPEGLIPLLI